MTTALVVGIAKEYYDIGRKGHSASVKDIVANVAGILLGGYVLSW